MDIIPSAPRFPPRLSNPSPSLLPGSRVGLNSYKQVCPKTECYTRHFFFFFCVCVCISLFARDVLNPTINVVVKGYQSLPTATLLPSPSCLRPRTIGFPSLPPPRLRHYSSSTNGWTQQSCCLRASRVFKGRTPHVPEETPHNPLIMCTVVYSTSILLMIYQILRITYFVL